MIKVSELNGRCARFYGILTWPGGQSDMNTVIFFFGSGLAFFVGNGLVLLGLLLTTARQRPRLCRLGPLTAIVGMILIALSATPLPYWFYALFGVTMVFWLIAQSLRLKISHIRVGLVRIAAAIVSLAGVAMELPYCLTPTVAVRGTPALWIIGDSVTAGVGMDDSKTEKWPRILVKQHDMVVHDYSQIGATVGTALKRLENEPLGDGIVLLEIGGNDLLGTTKVADFEERLDRLLAVVCQPGRTVVMFELPLPPFCNDYGEVQRRLAAHHGVTLIPKRFFVEVLTAGDATLDGVHLTQRGHQLMADTVWRLVGSN